MIFLIALTAVSTEPPIRFACTETTHVAPNQVWELWTDLTTWPTWDSGLKKAQLNSTSLGLGSKGTLIPDRGPKARFAFTEWEEGKQYAFSTQLPLAKLVVKRYWRVDDGQTLFTHEVSFTGPLKKFWAKRLGKRYEQMLPQVLADIKQLLESEEGRPEE